MVMISNAIMAVVLYILRLLTGTSSSSSFMNPRKTGLNIYATLMKRKVIMSVIGMKTINSPTTPGQNARGKNGASVEEYRKVSEQKLLQPQTLQMK